MNIDLYLLHFEQPYKHARHYLGIARNGIERRIEEHRAGKGANITAVVKRNGIGFVLAKSWLNVPFKSEKKIKGRGLKVYCPICSQKPREPTL